MVAKCLGGMSSCASSCGVSVWAHIWELTDPSINTFDYLLQTMSIYRYQPVDVSRPHVAIDTHLLTSQDVSMHGCALSCVHMIVTLPSFFHMFFGFGDG